MEQRESGQWWNRRNGKTKHEAWATMASAFSQTVNATHLLGQPDTPLVKPETCQDHSTKNIANKSENSWHTKMRIHTNKRTHMHIIIKQEKQKEREVRFSCHSQLRFLTMYPSFTYTMPWSIYSLKVWACVIVKEFPFTGGRAVAPGSTLYWFQS